MYMSFDYAKGILTFILGIIIAFFTSYILITFIPN